MPLCILHDSVRPHELEVEVSMGRVEDEEPCAGPILFREPCHAITRGKRRPKHVPAVLRLVQPSQSIWNLQY